MSQARTFHRPEYGAITVMRPEPLVEYPAPQTVLITLELLSTLHCTHLAHMAEPDLLHVGHDTAGNIVNYKIVGWDPEGMGLVGELRLSLHPNNREAQATGLDWPELTTTTPGGVE